MAYAAIDIAADAIWPTPLRGAAPERTRCHARRCVLRRLPPPFIYYAIAAAAAERAIISAL